jgi:glycosyltransferase involved in cell wall biosynthesis
VTGPVVQVTPYYPPHLGGVEMVVASLAQALGELGHDVRVITTTCGARGAPRRERVGPVEVRRSAGIEIAHTPVAPGLLPALLRTSPDAVLHLHVAHAVLPELVRLASALRRRRYLIHFHLDVDASGPLGVLLPGYKKHFFGPALRGAAAVLVLSAEQARFVVERYRVLPGRVHVVPNGVGEAYLDLGRRRAEPSRVSGAGPLEAEVSGAGPPGAGRPLRLLYFGRLSRQKNLPRLIQAMSLVPADRVRLTVVGDGEDRRLVQRMVADRGLSSVRLVGARRGTELVQTLAVSDAFVLPSDKEGMPLVLLEAMAAGLPVVATDVPGTRELAQGVAVLVRPDPQSLARGIVELAADPVGRHQRALAGRAVASRHSWRSVAGQVRSIYQQVG